MNELLVVATVVAAALVLLLLAGRRQTNRTRQALRRTRMAVERMAEPLGEPPPDRPLPDWATAALVARARDVLEVEWAVVFLTVDGHLRVEASAGPSPRTLGEVAARDALRSSAPLMRGDVRVGALEVGGRIGKGRPAEDPLVIEIVADRIASAVEQATVADAERRARLGVDHTRRQVEVLAQAALLLSPVPGDPESAIAATADVLVPELADWYAVDLWRDDGSLDRIVDTSRDRGPAINGMPGWDDFVRKLTASGVSEFGYVNGGVPSVGCDPCATHMQELGYQSWVIAPLRAHDATYGSIALATRASRRGFRPVDRAAIDDLAARLGLAIERGRMHEAAQRAALAEAQWADLLSRLLEAAIALNQGLVPAALPATLAEQAALVVGASYSRVSIDLADGLEAEHGIRPHRAVRAGSSLLASDGTTIGHISVERTSEAAFTEDEEAILTLLARLASVSVQNALLYDEGRRREHRLEAVIGASPLAILELDLAGCVVDANPAARALLPPADDDQAIVSLPAELRSCLRELTGVALGGATAEREIATTNASGAEMFLWISAAAMHPRPRAPIGILAVISDTTARTHLEAQLVNAQRAETIALLAGAVAHDFNNLLTIILGYGDLLRRTVDPQSREYEHLDAIHEAAHYASVITNQLLTLSRHQIVQPQVLEASAACEDLLPILRRLAGESVEIELRRHACVNIRIDPGQLEQVLFNLVLNGRDAMSGRGHLTIECGTRSGDDGQEFAVLSVADDGVGMDEATLSKCQEPFFTSKGRRGIGLGLATVARIVRQWGGSLELASALGKGTTASVSCPMIRDDVEPIDTSPAGAPRVLLVDDEAHVRQFVAEALSGAGYDVTATPAAEQALERAADDGAFDLLLSDIMLPGISGFDLAQRMAVIAPSTARLLMTGYADPDQYRPDPDDPPVLTKPFSADELLQAVAATLQASHGSKR